MKKALFFPGKKCLLFLLVVLTLSSAHAQQHPSGDLGETETTWPGVVMQIVQVQRIANDRLLFLVRILATPRAPRLTLIGYPAVIPKNATKEERAMGFSARPFSLDASRMIDEQTGQTYPELKPLPGGPTFRPAITLTSLAAGQGILLCVQFAAPPPPLVDDSGRPVKQTVTLLLTKARNAISRIPVPPPVPAPSPAAH